MPYPNGNQCVIINFKDDYIEQTINLNVGSYTLFFMACARKAVPSTRPFFGDPIYIQLNGTTFFTVTSPNVWTRYSTTFNVTTSGNNTIKFTGQNIYTDKTIGFQGISISNTNNNTITVSIKSNIVDNGINTTDYGLSFKNVTSFYNNTNLKIIQFGNIPLSRSGSQFSGLTKLTIEDTKSPIILSNTSMASMFQNATNFNSDISGWNTINVTNMSSMFQSASNFNQNIGSWVTSKVTNMSSMFNSASAFNQKISYDASNNYWDTTKVTDMNSIFQNASVFNNGQGVGGITQPMNWIISFTGTLTNFFSTSSALTDANKPAQFDFIYSFDYIGSTTTSDIIANIPIIKSSNNINYSYTVDIINIINGNFSQPNISFNTIKTITSTSNIQVTSWDCHNVKLVNNSLDQDYLFALPYPNGDQCIVIQDQEYMEQTISLNTGSYTLSFMACENRGFFARGGNPIDIQLNGTTFFSFTPPATEVWTRYITTFNVTTTGNNTIKFTGIEQNNSKKTALNDININKITVSIKSNIVDNGTNTTDYGLSFKNVTSFYNNINLKIIQFGNIPLSRGGSQFSNLSKLTIEDTKSPLVLSNTSMASMFQNATNFNSDISRWNTSNVTNMSSMFQSASAFNRPIGGWVTSNVTNMSYMFNGASAFNQSIRNWITSNVTNMSSMFQSASNFNQNIGSWNTSNVTDMDSIFNGASKFNNGQAAGGTTQKMNWIISFTSITIRADFLLNSALTPENAPTFKISNITIVM